jgi:hypothetical protein
LKKTDRVLSVLQDQPVPRNISDKDLETELLVKGLGGLDPSQPN